MCRVGISTENYLVLGKFSKDKHNCISVVSHESQFAQMQFTQMDSYLCRQGIEE